MRLLDVVAVAAWAWCATGCGLDMSGLGPPSPGDDAGVSMTGDAASADGLSSAGDDAGSDGTIDGSTADTGAAGSCAAGLPSGWSVVVYETSRGACPAGYGASHDEVAGATAGADACACTCNVTAQPTCTQGTMSTQYAGGGPSGSGQCASPGEPLSINGPGCTKLPQGGQLGQGFSAEAVGPSGGACTAALSPNPGQVTKNGVRTCDVPSGELAAVCSGSAPAGFSACITTAGDVPCPAGPFTTRSRIDDDEVLVCPPCGACSVASTCGGAQVKFFTDAQCQAAVATLACSGSCVPTGAANQVVVAFEYTAAAQATCQASVSGTPSFNPVQPHTVCCR